MTIKTMLLRALKIWLAIALALAAVHRLRDGDWAAVPADLAWAALAALLAVASQRWHAARGAACALCAEAPPPTPKKGADHV